MQCHRCRSKFPMNAPAITDIAMTQRRRFGANIPMNVFVIVNVSGTQHRAFYDDCSIHVFDIVIVLMVQRRRCCSFDSPGLASESVVYPGSFVVSGNNAEGVVLLIY